MALRTVDFPAPLGPITATSSPPLDSERGSVQSDDGSVANGHGDQFQEHAGAGPVGSVGNAGGWLGSRLWGYVVRCCHP